MDVHGLAGYLGGDIHAVAEEREARQGEIVLEGFVEVEAEVGEDHPKLLPAVGVLELAEEVAGELVLQGPLVVHDGHAGGEVQRGGGEGGVEGEEGWETPSAAAWLCEGIQHWELESAPSIRI